MAYLAPNSSCEDLLIAPAQWGAGCTIILGVVKLWLGFIMHNSYQSPKGYSMYPVDWKMVN